MEAATMSQGPNRILDEFARLATDAVGAAQGMRREAETIMRAQAERLLRDMDVATREEVAVLRDLVSALREENERLAARVAALEAGTKPTPEPASA
jgi:BMFP domain-containing protein YqiC